MGWTGSETVMRAFAAADLPFLFLLPICIRLPSHFNFFLPQFVVYF